MLVKFISHCDIYMPGEVADFRDDKAQRLIKARAAIAADRPEPSPSQPVPAPKQTRNQDETATMPPDETAIAHARRKVRS